MHLKKTKRRVIKRGLFYTPHINVTTNYDLKRMEECDDGNEEAYCEEMLEDEYNECAFGGEDAEQAESDDAAGGSPLDRQFPTLLRDLRTSLSNIQAATVGVPQVLTCALFA